VPDDNITAVWVQRARRRHLVALGSSLILVLKSGILEGANEGLLRGRRHRQIILSTFQPF
jgi:hypothetical protein